MYKIRIRIFMIPIILILLMLFAFTAYNSRHINKSDLSDILHRETIYFTGSDEIKFDEEYALSVSVIIYNQLYNKLYDKDDFVIEKTSFGGNEKVWNVYLKEPREQFLKKHNYDLFYCDKNGLMIDMSCGAIIANCGEKY